jgi:hypothetical protein
MLSIELSDEELRVIKAMRSAEDKEEELVKVRQELKVANAVIVRLLVECEHSTTSMLRLSRAAKGVALPGHLNNAKKYTAIKNSWNKHCGSQRRYNVLDSELSELGGHVVGLIEYDHLIEGTVG